MTFALGAADTVSPKARAIVDEMSRLGRRLTLEPRLHGDVVVRPHPLLVAR